MKYLFFFLYYFIARLLPPYWFPLGSYFNNFRVFCLRKFGVIIGKDCIVEKGAWVSKDVIMGDRASIGENARINKGVKFGNDTLMGPDVIILTSNHKFVDGNVARSERKHAHVNIGNQVWIGARSIILPGVTIGNNVIVGAGSIVTKDLKSWGVYAGNPAVYIKNIKNYA